MLLRSDQRQRPRLHQALIDLCFERGFAQVTVTDLDECFFEAYEVEVRRFTRLMAAARACPGGRRDRLRATAYALLSFLRDDERVTNFVAVEVRAASERAQSLFGSWIDGGIFHQIYGAVGQGQSLAPGSRIVPEMMYAAVLPYLGPEVAREELALEPPADLDPPRSS